MTCRLRSNDGVGLLGYWSPPSVEKDANEPLSLATLLPDDWPDDAKTKEAAASLRIRSVTFNHDIQTRQDTRIHHVRPISRSLHPAPTMAEDLDDAVCQLVCKRCRL